MHPQTEAVMDRYRELGSTLEASRTVLEETGCRMWHRVGGRCPCGHLSIPSPFYAYNPTIDKERSQKEAGAAYLEWLGSDKRPAWVNPPVLGELRTERRTETPRTVIKRTGRPKKWASEAERLRAYRERK